MQRGVTLGNALRCRAESPLQERGTLRSEYRAFLSSQVEAEVLGVSTVRLFLVSAKTDNLVDGVYDGSLGTIEPNGVLKYGHNLCMSTSRWICIATDTADVKERIHYAAWFANLALHRDAAVLGLNGSLHRLHDENTTLLTQRLVLRFQELNRVENVHGIVVQLPHPRLSTAVRFYKLLSRRSIRIA